VSKTVEQINDYLFIYAKKSNKVKIGMSELRVNDSEMSMRCSLVNTRDISPEIAQVNIDYGGKEQ